MTGIIRCDDIEAFYECIENLTKRGLVFDARTADFTVTLTGGY